MVAYDSVCVPSVINGSDNGSITVDGGLDMSVTPLAGQGSIRVLTFEVAHSNDTLWLDVGGDIGAAGVIGIAAVRLQVGDSFCVPYYFDDNSTDSSNSTGTESSGSANSESDWNTSGASSSWSSTSRGSASSSMGSSDSSASAISGNGTNGGNNNGGIGSTEALVCNVNSNPWQAHVSFSVAPAAAVTALCGAVMASVAAHQFRMSKSAPSKLLYRAVASVNGLYGEKIVTSWVAILWCFLDLLFRTAPFMWSVVPWQSTNFATAQEFFHALLLVVHQWSLVALGIIGVIILALTVGYADLYRVKKDVNKPASSLVLLRSQTSTSPSPVKATLAYVTWAAVGVARLASGVLLLPCLYILLSPWLCASSNLGVDTGNVHGHFVTSDCAAGARCFGGGHYILMVVSACAIAFIIQVLVRIPVSMGELTAYGLPLYPLLSIPLRLGLAWSARVLIYFSPSWSVFMSLWFNVALSCVTFAWLLFGGASISAGWIAGVLIITNAWAVAVGVVAASLLYRSGGSTPAAVIVAILLVVTVIACVLLIRAGLRAKDADLTSFMFDNPMKRTQNDSDSLTAHDMEAGTGLTHAAADGVVPAPSAPYARFGPDAANEAAKGGQLHFEADGSAWAFHKVDLENDVVETEGVGADFVANMMAGFEAPEALSNDFPAATTNATVSLERNELLQSAPSNTNNAIDTEPISLLSPGSLFDPSASDSPVSAAAVNPIARPPPSAPPQQLASAGISIGSRKRNGQLGSSPANRTAFAKSPASSSGSAVVKRAAPRPPKVAEVSAVSRMTDLLMQSSDGGDSVDAEAMLPSDAPLTDVPSVAAPAGEHESESAMSDPNPEAAATTADLSRAGAFLLCCCCAQCECCMTVCLLLPHPQMPYQLLPLHLILQRSALTCLPP